jgi:hypothetical protein
MIRRNCLAIVIGFLLFGPLIGAPAKLPKDELLSLFNQANEAFAQANSMADHARAEKLYEKTILTYERMINEGEIKNAKLYYNLANAYFLKEDLGRAILNYRRAEKLGGADDNIRKNLAFARSRRIDKVLPRTEKRVLQTLFFWHYDFSLQTKFFLSCLFFAVVCVAAIAIIWLGRSPGATAAGVIAGILMLCFVLSVVVEARHSARTICGVITAQQVVARQGDGQNYPASFKDPLHAGTEFDLLERRPGWLHIILADGSDCWMPDDAAGLI